MRGARRRGGQGGPVEVRATLPGLVVAVAVQEGDEVAEARQPCSPSRR